MEIYQLNNIGTLIRIKRVNMIIYLNFVSTVNKSVSNGDFDSCIGDEPLVFLLSIALLQIATFDIEKLIFIYVFLE